MIKDIVDTINTYMPKDAKVYGIAQSMIKEEKLFPALVDKEGEGKNVVIDNTLPVIIYHKVNSLTISYLTKGTGRNIGDIKNTHNNTMIVYLNRKKYNMLPDELIIKIQSALPDFIPLSPYKQIVIRFLNVILDSQQVFAKEYQNVKNFITPESNLFAINYQIESTFAKECFVTC